MICGDDVYYTKSTALLSFIRKSKRKRDAVSCIIETTHGYYIHISE